MAGWKSHDATYLSTGPKRGLRQKKESPSARKPTYATPMPETVRLDIEIVDQD